jgi:FkbM family methyltransferase
MAKSYNKPMILFQKIFKFLGSLNSCVQIKKDCAYLDRKPIYLDVGSSGGQDYLILLLTKLKVIQTYSVDPADEWGSKNRSHACGNIINVGLGKTDSSVRFNITKHPGCSSCLIPNYKILGEYPISDWFTVVKEKNVKIRSYHSLVQEGCAPRPDFVKLDVQGYEFHVLDGFSEVLNSVQGVEIECHFRPLYDGQALFQQIYDKMRDSGLKLRKLSSQGNFGGEIVEVNAFFSRGGDSPLESIWRNIANINLAKCNSGCGSTVAFESLCQVSKMN